MQNDAASRLLMEYGDLPLLRKFLSGQLASIEALEELPTETVAVRRGLLSPSMAPQTMQPPVALPILPAASG